MSVVERNDDDDDNGSYYDNDYIPDDDGKGVGLEDGCWEWGFVFLYVVVLLWALIASMVPCCFGIIKIDGTQGAQNLGAMFTAMGVGGSYLIGAAIFYFVVPVILLIVILSNLASGGLEPEQPAMVFHHKDY